jgi:hypothetical protein
MFEDIIKCIEKEQKRYTEFVKVKAEGLPRDGEGWEIQFQNRSTTNWDKIKKTYLEGIDLKPFVKQSAAMLIRRK